MRTWLIKTKGVAVYVSRDCTNHVDKEISVTYFVSSKNEQNFYKAVKEWCQQKGYPVQLP